jgi:hypothetical protein
MFEILLEVYSFYNNGNVRGNWWYFSFLNHISTEGKLLIIYEFLKMKKKSWLHTRRD